MSACSKCHRDLPPAAHFCAACGAPVVAVPVEGADAFIGQVVRGVYFVQALIGGGGMGQVYRAMHVTLDVPVALKVLKKSLLSDPSIVQRFHREARAASRLRHPNVIGVTDFGQLEDGTLFMAMEHIAGRSLAKVIADEAPVAEARVVHIGAQILSALAEAHAAGILHRDLKPDNVMLEARRDDQDMVKVLDFGIAKIQQAEGGNTLTQAGMVCGTPGYMSPEQWSGEELDARSDLYAVGVILYELLTGKIPFDSSTPLEIVRKHLTEKPAPPSARRSGPPVSEDLEALVMRAISNNRDDRPASADEMRQDLLACIVAASPLATPAPGAGAPRTVFLARATPPGSPTMAIPAAADGEPGRPSKPRTPARPGTPGPRKADSGARKADSGSRKAEVAGRRATPPPATPRHESDDDEALEQDEGLEADQAGAADAGRRKRLGLIAAAAAVVIVAGVGLTLMLRGGKPDPAKPAAYPASVPQPAAPTPPDASASAGAPTASPASPPAVGPSVPASATPVAPPPATRPAPPETRPASPPVQPSPLATPQPGVQPPGPAAQVKKVPPPPPAVPAVAAAPKAVRRGDPPLEIKGVINALRTPAAVTEEGILVVQVEQFGDVFLDDRPYGEAPREFRVKAGVYRARVVNDTLGRREADLTVRAGERKVWTVDFLRKN